MIPGEWVEVWLSGNSDMNLMTRFHFKTMNYILEDR